MDEPTTLPDPGPNPAPAFPEEPSPLPTSGPGEDTTAIVRAALDESAERHRAVLARLRDAILAAEPALPPELVQGDTLEALEANAESARQAVRRIREAVAREAPQVPAGAPGRTVTQPLSAWEKIRAGVARL